MRKLGVFEKRQAEILADIPPEFHESIKRLAWEISNKGAAMKLEEEFDKRIAALHGGTGESPMDIRHAEFQIMADVFLGEDFDQTKLRQVEELQVALHLKQGELVQRYEAGKIRAEDYVQSINALLEETFRQCETILGQEDFLKLFGTTRSRSPLDFISLT